LTAERDALPDDTAVAQLARVLFACAVSVLPAPGTAPSNAQVAGFWLNCNSGDSRQIAAAVQFLELLHLRGY
jgi:hypothetical protein